MSIILDALRKAKNLATGSAPKRAPAYLKSFGFGEQQVAQNKAKKILIFYVLPVVILGSVIAAGVMHWIRSNAESAMQEQAQLLEPEGGFLALEDELEEAPLGGEELPAMQAEGAREGDPATDDGATSDPVDKPGGQAEAGASEAAVDPTLTAGIASPEPSPAEAETPEAPEPEPVVEQEELVTNSPEAGASASEVVISSSASDPFELAVRYQQMGEYLKAFEFYQEVLEQSDFNAQAHNNIGLIHMALSDNSQAIESLRRAIRIDPDYDKAHNNLGTALVNDGQESESEREFKRALDLNTKNAEAMTNLAILYRNAGQLEEAKFEYLRALQMVLSTRYGPLLIA